MVRKDPPSAEGAGGGAATAGASTTLPSMVLEMVVTAEQLPTGWHTGNPSPAPMEAAAGLSVLVPSPPPAFSVSARGLPSNSAIKSR